MSVTNIILINDVTKLGKPGDSVEVKRGFAKYLLRFKKAIPATKENLENLDKIRNEKLKENEKRNSEALKLKKFIEDKVINIIRDSSDEGVLYASINANDIYKEISEIANENNIEFESDKNSIGVSTKIKNTGINNISIFLTSKVTANLKLNIGRNSSEIEENIKNQ